MLRYPPYHGGENKINCIVPALPLFVNFYMVIVMVFAKSFFSLRERVRLAITEAIAMGGIIPLG